MPDETMAWLSPRAGGVYCDATLGGGGHAERILRATAPDGRLIGIDRDPSALEAAGARLAEFGRRVSLVHGSFGDARAILERLGAIPVDGFVLDLGARGFSFRHAGPLDMRMDPTGGETAEGLIRRIGVDELADILRRYGEER